MHSMEREGAQQQEEYNSERRASGACPDPSPTLWDGVNMSGPRKGHTRVPHGLETYGVPAPCITNSWPQEWSARGN